jgi:hypothetical protein
MDAYSPVDFGQGGTMRSLPWDGKVIGMLWVKV